MPEVHVQTNDILLFLFFKVQIKNYHVTSVCVYPAYMSYMFHMWAIDDSSCCRINFSTPQCAWLPWPMGAGWTGPSCQQRCIMGVCGCTCCPCTLASTHQPLALSSKWGISRDAGANTAVKATHSRCQPASAQVSSSCVVFVIRAARGNKPQLKRISSAPLEKRGFLFIQLSCIFFT